MKADKLIEQRFSELAKKAEEIAANPIRYPTGDVGINDEKFQAWATSTLSHCQEITCSFLARRGSRLDRVIPFG